MPHLAPLITSRGNQHVKQLRAALAQPPAPSSASPSSASPADLLALEGEHLLDEALRSSLRLRTLFLREDRAAPSRLTPGASVLHLSADLFQSISSTQSPQGIAALVEAPVFTLEQSLASPAPLLLILDALQDPGNLGTLLRSAEAFGATGALLLAGSANPWSSKALRASAGSAFRLPALTGNLATVRDLASRGLQLLAAVGQSTAAQPAVDPAALDLTRPTAILIGNEGAGLSPELLALAHTRVTLPCTGPVESLNAAVAGSLLLFAAQQQRTAARP